MNGTRLTFGSDEDLQKAQQDSTELLKSLLCLNRTLTAKVVYVSQSTLPGSKRGYAFFVPTMTDALYLKIENVTYDIALLTGKPLYSGEGACMLVQGRKTLEQIIQDLSVDLFGDRQHIKLQIEY